MYLKYLYLIRVVNKRVRVDLLNIDVISIYENLKLILL